MDGLRLLAAAGATLLAWLGALGFAAAGTGQPADAVLLQPMSQSSGWLDLAGAVATVGAVGWGFLFPGAFLVLAYRPRLCGTASGLAVAVMLSAGLAFVSTAAASGLFPSGHRVASILLLALLTLPVAVTAWRRRPPPLCPPGTLRVALLAGLSVLLLFSPKFTAEDVSVDGMEQVVECEWLLDSRIDLLAPPSAPDRSAVRGVLPDVQYGDLFARPQASRTLFSAPLSLWLGVSEASWTGPWSWGTRLPFLVTVMLLAATLWTMASHRGALAGGILWAQTVLVAMLCLYTPSSSPWSCPAEGWVFLLGGLFVLWIHAGLLDGSPGTAAAALVLATLLWLALAGLGLLILALYAVFGGVPRRTLGAGALWALLPLLWIFGTALSVVLHHPEFFFGFADKYVHGGEILYWNPQRFLLLGLLMVGGPTLPALFHPQYRAWAAQVLAALGFFLWTPHRDLQHLTPVAFLSTLALLRSEHFSVRRGRLVLAALAGVLILLWPLAYPVQRPFSDFWTATWAETEPYPRGHEYEGLQLLAEAGLLAPASDVWLYMARRNGDPQTAPFLVLRQPAQVPADARVLSRTENYVLATRAPAEVLDRFRNPVDPWEIYRPLLGVVLGEAWARERGRPR